MTCQVCGYHSGPLTHSQWSCPRVHPYRPIEPATERQLRERLAVWERSVSPHAAEMVERCRRDLARWEQEQDDIGGHMRDVENMEEGKQ